MTENERTARTFAEQFTPPLRVTKTERINNVPVPDAWSVTYWDDAKKVGITATAHSGQLHAYLECAGPAKHVGTPIGAVRTGETAWHQASPFAIEAGRVIAKALGMLNSCGTGEHCAMETGDAIENEAGQRICSYCKKPVNPESGR